MIKNLLSSTIITTLIASVIGVSLSFYLNHRKDEKKIKQEEINKSHEFLSKLYVVAHALLQYKLNYLSKKEISYKDIPAMYSGLLPDKFNLNVKNISFCSKGGKKGMEFLSDAYIFELNIERVNKLLLEHSEIIKEVNKKIEVYKSSNDVEKVDYDNDEEIEKVLGSRLAEKLNHFNSVISKQVPFLYEESMKIQKKHRKIMKTIYPKATIREFEF